jgi:hypothetical protein
MMLRLDFLEGAFLQVVVERGERGVVVAGVKVGDLHLS